MSDLLTIPGIGPSIKSALEAKGIQTKSDLVGATVEDLTAIRGITASKAHHFIASAQAATSAPANPASTGPASADPVETTLLAPAPSASKPPKDRTDATGNVLKLVPDKPKTSRKDDAKTSLEAAQTARKKAKANLKRAKAKLAKAVKALKAATKGKSTKKKATRTSR